MTNAIGVSCLVNEDGGTLRDDETVEERHVQLGTAPKGDYSRGSDCPPRGKACAGFVAVHPVVAAMPLKVVEVLAGETARPIEDRGVIVDVL
jgi:hypothetical protein